MRLNHSCIEFGRITVHVSVSSTKPSPSASGHSGEAPIGQIFHLNQRVINRARLIVVNSGDILGFYSLTCINSFYINDGIYFICVVHPYFSALLRCISAANE
jgi:hypothetical protein